MGTLVWPGHHELTQSEIFMSDSTFNEAEYLEANPDVAAAVKEGNFRSGREHYKMYGEREGRILKRLLGIALPLHNGIFQRIIYV